MLSVMYKQMSPPTPSQVSLGALEIPILPPTHPRGYDHLKDGQFE